MHANLNVIGRHMVVTKKIEWQVLITTQTNELTKDLTTNTFDFSIHIKLRHSLKPIIL